MDQLDPTDEDPWRPVRHILLPIWFAQFFVCWAMTFLGYIFVPIFDLIMIIPGALFFTAHVLYLHQVHLYATGTLTPLKAVKLQGVQCLNVTLLLGAGLIPTITPLGDWIIALLVILAISFYVLFFISIRVMRKQRQQVRGNKSTSYESRCSDLNEKAVKKSTFEEDALSKEHVISEKDAIEWKGGV